MTQPSSTHDYVSEIFSTIYYAKKSLKVLLEERSQIIERLHLKPERGQFEQIIESVLLLFNEPPLELEAANLLVLRQSGLFFVFFSTDYKYLPLCKICSCSVYISRNSSKGKIICCNPKCKRSVLEEFEVRAKQPQLQAERGRVGRSSSFSKITPKHESPFPIKTITLNKEQVLRAIDRILK